MTIGIDHIVIAVNDLERAVADYAAAGFTVTPAGTTRAAQVATR